MSDRIYKAALEQYEARCRALRLPISEACPDRSGVIPSFRQQEGSYCLRAASGGLLYQLPAYLDKQGHWTLSAPRATRPRTPYLGRHGRKARSRRAELSTKCADAPHGSER